MKLNALDNISIKAASEVILEGALVGTGRLKERGIMKLFKICTKRLLEAGI